MKKAVKACAFALGAALLFGLVCSGCASADNGNAQSAQFPEIERWWK